MKIRCLIVCIPLLASCVGAPKTVWFAPGTPVQRVDADLSQCEASALEQFPIRYRVATSPGLIIGAQGCKGAVCVGINNDREVYDYDRNLPDRNRAVGLCMGTKGYSLATLPSCPRGDITPVERQPSDVEGLCVSRGELHRP